MQRALPPARTLNHLGRIEALRFSLDLPESFQAMTPRETFAERAVGQQASRLRAVVAALMVGTGAAVLTYRVLRSGESA